MAVRVVSRQEWGGPPPEGADPIPPIISPVKYVVITLETPTAKCHSDEECVKVMRQLHHYYVVQRNLPEIPFNFLVANDGTIYEARGWNAEPSRSLRYFVEYHGDRLDIAFLGDYTSEIYPPIMSQRAFDVCGIGIEKGLVDRFFEVLEYRDKEKMLATIAAEKNNKPWENWQLQEMAEKIFHKQMEYWEVHEKMKDLIPHENMPNNEFCVIM